MADGIKVEDLVDAAAVAAMKGVQVKTVYEWVRLFPAGTEGGVPAKVLGDFYLAADWQAWTRPGPGRDGPRKRPDAAQGAASSEGQGGQ